MSMCIVQCAHSAECITWTVPSSKQRRNTKNNKNISPFAIYNEMTNFFFNLTSLQFAKQINVFFKSLFLRKTEWKIYEKKKYNQKYPMCERERGSEHTFIMSGRRLQAAVEAVPATDGVMMAAVELCLDAKYSWCWW